MLEKRRFRAIALLEQGVSVVDVAQRLGVDRRSVRRWRAAARRSGVISLKARPAPGRPPKLDTRQRLHLERALLEGARTAGFATDLWTCLRVARWIGQTYGVCYHPDHVGRLLRSLGWSAQRPWRRVANRGAREGRR